MSLKSFPIVGLTKGYQTNVKPAMLPDQAYALLQNSYTFRERELKREGRKFLGRLRRVLTSQSLGTTIAGPPNTVTITDIFTTLSITGEPNAEIEPGSLFIAVGVPDTASFTDLGNGTFSVTGSGVAAGSYVNYLTGEVVLQFTVLVGGGAITANLNYYPTLPCTGILQREISTLNDEETVWFDTKYAYVWTGSGFEEFIRGTTWNGQSENLFWATNYRGADAFNRLFFVTNDVPDVADPIRYTDGATWTDFDPLITATTKLFQCLIIIPYYGRLLALNTWEGTTADGPTAAKNFFNRCRFSQLGDATDQMNAWRIDIFGKGGSLDAPTNEQITGATFIKNTLVVDFERSTWQLRYVGEYGLPFIWERVSADFGSESTFSGVLFDNHRLSIGDKAITAATGNGVNRIDLEIPDQVFDFLNSNFGPQRITGIRDYKKELVFWNYGDSQTQAAPGIDLTFSNKVLLYNYRNNSWATFDDGITCFGTFQSQVGLTTNITWNDNSVFWDDENITWDDSASQSLFPLIVCGNQQGFISCYGYDGPPSISTVDALDQETLTITAIDLTTTPIKITSPAYNLQDGDTIYITGMNFVNSSTFLTVPTSLNNKIYRVNWITSSPTVDQFTLSVWDFATQTYTDSFSFTPDPATSLYVGGGRITHFPRMNILTKDINIFQGQSLQTKLSRLDFLFQPEMAGAVTVNLYLNASTDGSIPGVVGGKRNFGKVGGNLVWSSNMSIDTTGSFYTPGSQYAWFRYYATLAAQYFSINITYDDNLMNTLTTHKQDATLYAINAWCREGGKNVY